MFVLMTRVSGPYCKAVVEPAELAGVGLHHAHR